MKQDNVAANHRAAPPASAPGLSLADPWPQIVLCLVVGLGLRAKGLAAKPFWFDECFSVEVSRLSWPNFLHLLWWREANMSLYYLLLRIWLAFGQSPFHIRFLSALLAAATVAAIYWLADLLYGRRVGLIAAVLFTFNADSVRYSQEARSYALFVLLATMSSGFLVSWLAKPANRSRAGYIAASVLAAYAHFYALLLVAAHGLALRWGGPSGLGEAQRRELRRMWRSIAIGVSPLLVFVAKTGAGPIKWIHRPGPGDVLRFFEHLAGGNNWGLMLLYAIACAAALVRPGTDPGAGETWKQRFLLTWLVFPVALTVLLSWARPVFLARYLIFTLPALLVLASAGLSRLRRPWALAAALLPTLLLASQGISYVYGHDFDSERDASGEAANFILDHWQPGDGILFHIAETRVPYEFFRSLKASEDTASPRYAGNLGPEIVFPNHGPGLDYRDFTGKPAMDFVREQVPKHPRLWLMLMDNAPAGVPDPTTQMLTQVLPGFFPGVTRWEFDKAEVRLYRRP